MKSTIPQPPSASCCDRVVAKLTPSVAPPTRTGNHEKGIGDGAAGDLTIVRPAAAAPPSRPEQVEQHRAAEAKIRRAGFLRLTPANG
jgi:hypothetical protein